MIRLICWPHDSPNLFHGLEVWAESAVTTEDLLVNDGGNGQAVETVCEGLPQLDVVPPFAFIIETIDAVDGGTLVVSSQQEKVLRVSAVAAEDLLVNNGGNRQAVE